MDRKGFFGSLAALIAAPMAVKAMKLDKLIAADSIPEIPITWEEPFERFVSYLHFEYAGGHPIPSIDLTMLRAPASTICSFCRKRYDQHQLMPTGLRVVCDGRGSRQPGM
jgi:hypothetical protein